MSATVKRVTISRRNPDPRFNGVGFGVHNGRVGNGRKWHAYVFYTKELAQKFADAVNQDYDRFAPVNLGYPEPFAFAPEDALERDVTLAQSLVTAWTVWQKGDDRSQEDACRIMRDVVNQELHSDTERLWMLMVWRLQTTNDPRGFCTSDTPGAREAFDEMLRFFDDWLGAE